MEHGMGCLNYQPCGRAVNMGPGNNYPLHQPHHPNPSSVAPCFKCGGINHWARNCPEGGIQSNLIDLEEDLNSEPTYEPKDPVRDLKACINAMTTKEKGQLANEMGVGEDFPMA
jgi:hypothetical protein